MKSSVTCSEWRWTIAYIDWCSYLCRVWWILTALSETVESCILVLKGEILCQRWDHYVNTVSLKRPQLISPWKQEGPVNKDTQWQKNETFQRLILPQRSQISNHPSERIWWYKNRNAYSVLRQHCQKYYHFQRPMKMSVTYSKVLTSLPLHLVVCGDTHKEKRLF